MKKLSEIGRASRASEVRSVLRTKEQDGTYLDPRELSGVQPKEPNQLMRISRLEVGGQLGVALSKYGTF